jgi:hypothetical protein
LTARTGIAIKKGGHAQRLCSLIMRSGGMIEIDEAD